MSCGCDQAVELTIGATEREREMAAQRGAIEARRQMCISCPHRRGSAWGCGSRPLGRCGASRQPIGLIIAGVITCPRGRHPDQTGRVRWLGVSWLGVPMPLRWISAALGRERGGIDDVDQLPGCGCIERLKTAAHRLAERLRL